MEQVQTSVAWYQQKIGSYDKQLWEQSVEQKVLKGIQQAPRRVVRPKTELIDVDLVRGSTFTKSKPQVPWTYITAKTFSRVVLFPFHYQWWIQQTSWPFVIFLMALYVMQISTIVVFFNYVGEELTQDEQSFSEVALPCILMVLLGLIHAQTSLTHLKPPTRDNKRDGWRRKRSLSQNRGSVSNADVIGASSTTNADNAAGQSRSSMKGHLGSRPLRERTKERRVRLKASGAQRTRKENAAECGSQDSESAYHTHETSDSLADKHSSMEQDSVRRAPKGGNYNMEQDSMGRVSTKGGKCCMEQDSIRRVASKGVASKGGNEAKSKLNNSSPRVLITGCEGTTGCCKTRESQESDFPQDSNSDDDKLAVINDGTESSKRHSQSISSDNEDEVDAMIESQKNSLNSRIAGKVQLCEKNGCTCGAVSAGGQNQKHSDLGKQPQNKNIAQILKRSCNKRISLLKLGGKGELAKKISFEGISVNNPPCSANSTDGSEKLELSAEHSVKQVTEKLELSAEHSVKQGTNGLPSPPQQKQGTNGLPLSPQQKQGTNGLTSSPQSGNRTDDVESSYCDISLNDIENSHGNPTGKTDKICTTGDRANATVTCDGFAHESCDNQGHGQSTVAMQSGCHGNHTPENLMSKDGPCDNTHGESFSKCPSINSGSNHLVKNDLDPLQRGSTPNTSREGTPTHTQSEGIIRVLMGGNLRHKSVDTESESEAEISGKKRELPPCIHRRKVTLAESVSCDTGGMILRNRRQAGLTTLLDAKTKTNNMTVVSSSDGETEGGHSSEYSRSSRRNMASSEEWGDHLQSEVDSTSETSSCVSEPEIPARDNPPAESDSDAQNSGSNNVGMTSSSIHAMNILTNRRQSSTASCSYPPDKVTCIIWERNECKKVELTALDIGWAIIDTVDKIPENSDYVYIGLTFSVFMALTPFLFAMFHSKEMPSVISWSIFSVMLEWCCSLSRLELLIHINAAVQRFSLSAIFFFLLSVADRTFKQRLLYAKHFCYLTSSRRARKFDLPHLRLNKVRNIRTWLSLRSYLKKRGPQRSVDVIVSSAFLFTLIMLIFMCLQLLREAETYLNFLVNWELLIWCMALGVYLLRFMTLGLRINKKYRNLSVLITEQINLYLQMEQKPHKKEELMVANNVLKLAESLLKELESPFKISGISANPLILNVTKVVVLSAFSAVLTELLGFKLKLYKIKLRA